MTCTPPTSDSMTRTPPTSDEPHFFALGCSISEMPAVMGVVLFLPDI